MRKQTKRKVYTPQSVPLPLTEQDAFSLVLRSHMAAAAVHKIGIKSIINVVTVCKIALEHDKTNDARSDAELRKILDVLDTIYDTRVITDEQFEDIKRFAAVVEDWIASNRIRYSGFGLARRAIRLRGGEQWE